MGRSDSEVAGKSALATPAASAAASPPGTRMVLRVAVYGKPSFSAACSSSLEAPGPPGCGSSSPRLHPASASAATTSMARVLRTARSTIARPAAIAAGAGMRRSRCGLPLLRVRLTGQSTSARRRPDDGFQAQRGAARVPGDLPQVRPRGHPADRGQVRPRGGRALGGHQGGPRVGAPRARPHPADGAGPGRRHQLHLRRGAPLGLRRNRARDPGRLAGRGRHRQLRHAGADRALGARVLRDGRRDQARRLRGHRGRAPARTCARCAPRPSRTATSGS